jgi:serine/threonine protein kinase
LALLCQLSHPNVLRVWGACTDSPGALILVMEYAQVFVAKSFQQRQHFALSLDF